MAQSRTRRMKKPAPKKSLQSKRPVKTANPKMPPTPIPGKTTKSLLDKMVDGREFESLLKFRAVNLEIRSEVRKAIQELESVRGRPLLCVFSNVMNSSIRAQIAIDNTDELPFAEMIQSIPDDVKEIDMMLVTPGGSGQQVAKFVDRLRPRFDRVSFIIPNMAMSAGTIFVLSGDEIIMDSRAYIGPIDPQIPDKTGQFVPAQAILSLLDDIQQRGEELINEGKSPLWTDLQILKQIEGKEIGNALNTSRYSIELVEDYLYNYKFKTWAKHSSDDRDVTDEEKKARAKEIAELLCDHQLWKTHSRGINRDVAWEFCKLKILHPETIPGLERTIRRFWALLYWIFENTIIYKIFISQNYCIFRHDLSLINKVT